MRHKSHLFGLDALQMFAQGRGIRFHPADEIFIYNNLNFIKIITSNPNVCVCVCVDCRNKYKHISINQHKNSSSGLALFKIFPHRLACKLG